MPDGSKMHGGWIMRPEDIEGLTPLQIQEKFALPSTPKYICDVELEAGTHLRVGEVNPLEGWGSGGGTQYDLIGQRVGNFTNERPLLVENVDDVVKANSFAEGTDTVLQINAKASSVYNNWDDMKEAYKGTVTKFVNENKPKGSPTPRKWFEKGGTIEIETLDDGSQIWKYTSADGKTVPYVNEQVKFPKQYLFPDEDIAEFSIGEFTGTRELDKKAALEILSNEGYDEIPDGYVLHHDYENGKMQLVREDIHRTFTHYGGNYYNQVGD